MTNRRISHAKGKGSLNHNNRIHIYENVDSSKTKNNIYYAKESLEDAYQKCFDEAVENYNAKQKRADRKINNYYTHLFGNANKDTVATSSNKENSFYEIVVGIGDKNTCAVGSDDGELATKILDEYAKGFSERNPNFYVFNSVMHLDETTPHLHIDYVPVADGYKNGLEIRNSQSVALQKMGFGKNKNSINEWRKQERKILEGLCKKYNLEIAEETKGRGKTFTPDEYKKIKDEAKENLKNDNKIMEDIYNQIIVEATNEIQEDISKEKEKLEKSKEQLEEERIEIEGKIAHEQRIKKMIEGTEEKSRFGKTKTIITYEGTSEEVMMVLNAAQQSSKNRTYVEQFKEERDTAIADKNAALKERDNAIKAKEQAEEERATAKSEATTVKKTADTKMSEAKALYNQQQNLNNLYETATTDLNDYKNQTNKLTEKNTKLQERLRKAYTIIEAMAKANASLLHDPKLKIEGLNPEQTRILQATRNYAIAHSKNARFDDIAQNIEKYYGLTKGIQNYIDELTPKPPKKIKERSQSYGHSL
jgi:hypothetical protein